MKPAYIVAALAAAVVIIVLVQFAPGWFASPEQQAEPATAPSPAEPIDMTPQTQAPEPEPVDPEPAEEPPAPEPLPTLAESDPRLRSELEGYGLPEPWLDTEGLIRRLAVTLDNAERGEYPRRQLQFLAPDGPFKAIERGDALYVDPASYARYDRYLDVLEAVPPEDLAALFVEFEPLVAEALGEVGNDTPPQQRLIGTVDQLLEVPILEGDVELIQPTVFYEYADRSLEALTPLQKQALRMGPSNVARLKAYLTELRALLSSR